MKWIYMSIFSVMVAAILVAMPSLTHAQNNDVRKSLHASVTQRLGVDTDITFDFSRPGVKGRKIWGDLEPYGMHKGNNASKNKPYPWRAGANENTTIEFNKNVKIEGNLLPAGKYGVHMIPSEKSDWIVIFSKRNSDWGSYSYDEKEDALRINVKPVTAPHQEWLIFGFENLAGTSATAFLHWEKIKIPFKIEVAE